MEGRPLNFPQQENKNYVPELRYDQYVYHKAQLKFILISPQKIHLIIELL
jgi:hypothetical protein